jgi:peptidoglycan hydrolase-like protein with peptidoglycan-binding domain
MLRKLEKYDILEEIGHGGMATVYRARDGRLDREVAIKVLHPHLRGAREARSRFEREARSVARLRHPNILEIYDYSGEASEESYIAAELLTGPTLKHFVEANPDIPAEVAACFAIEIASALGAAHACGIVHRDVKPENVLLHQNRCIKLTDFGIAQIVDAQSFTATGQVLGSPGHMAPEQVEGKDCDPRTDLFSLGTVLYYLATGRLPFSGKNPHQILKRIVDGDYTDPLRVCPAMGPHLAGIIRRLLERDPDARYPSAEALEQDLRAFVGQVGIEDPTRTLAEYLSDPPAFAERWRATAIEALTERGERAMAKRDVRAALDDFNRVLAMDEGNARVLGHLDRLQRRHGRRRALMLSAGMLLGVLGVVGMGFAMYGRSVQPADGPAGEASSVEGAVADPPAAEGSRAPDTERAAPGAGDPDDGTPNDPAPEGSAVASAEDASGSTGEPRDEPAPPRARRAAKPKGQARPAGSSAPRRVVFRPTPQNVLIGVDGDEPRPFGPSFHETELSPGRHRIVFKSGGDCCLDTEFTVKIPPGPGTTVVARRLPLRPAGLYVVTNVPAAVKVGDGAVKGRAREVLRVPMEDDFEQVVRLTVTAPDHADYTGGVRLRAGRVAEVNVRLEPSESPP